MNCMCAWLVRSNRNTKGIFHMATESLPATAEVVLKTDASKRFLDALLGQGWDTWGQGLGGTQPAEHAGAFRIPRPIRGLRMKDGRLTKSSTGCAVP